MKRPKEERRALRKRSDREGQRRKKGKAQTGKGAGRGRKRVETRKKPSLEKSSTTLMYISTQTTANRIGKSRPLNTIATAVQWTKKYV